MSRSLNACPALRTQGYISAEELLSIPELSINPLTRRLERIFDSVNFKVHRGLQTLSQQPGVLFSKHKRLHAAYQPAQLRDPPQGGRLLLLLHMHAHAQHRAQTNV